MRIELLTPEQYAEIISVYKNYPELTLENKGYEGINKSALSAEAQEANAKINTILKSAISGFSSFQNFCHTKGGEIRVRFQYNYNYDTNDCSFIGVGYILLSELLNGFNEA